MDPMSMNSDFNLSLLELAAENSLEMFETLISSVDVFDST